MGAIRSPEVVSPDRRWDRDADLVVVGGSIAGLSTALHAAELGAEVLVLEKAPAIGGTARKAVGGIWVPNNRFMQEAGVADPRDEALRYLARVARPALYDPEHPTLGLPAWELELFASLYDNADPAFRALEALGVALEQDPDFPDYYMHLPDVQAPRGRQLFPHNDDGTRGDGAALVNRLAELVAERGVVVEVEHRVVGVFLADDGAVVGVRVATPDGELAIGARRAVFFCSGGFTHDDELRREHLGGRVVGGCAALTNEGDWHRIAAALGIPLVHMDSAYYAPLVLEKMLARDPEMMGIFAVPGDSLIIVDASGARAHNEKATYQDRARAMLEWDIARNAYPKYLTFAIWDQRAADRYATGFLGGFIPEPGTPDGHVLRGDTLAELGEAIAGRLAALGRDAHGIALAPDFGARLTATVARYGEHARAGVDPDFHRGETPIEVTFHGPVQDDHDLPNPTMHPLAETGPYYATILAPGTLDTKGGPRVNPDGQVLGADGAPVPGLYAVGNATAAPTGDAYISGGITFGPILTSSWLAARHVMGTARDAAGAEAVAPVDQPA